MLLARLAAGTIYNYHHTQPNNGKALAYRFNGIFCLRNVGNTILLELSDNSRNADRKREKKKTFHVHV